jgi:WD40 repeat protein
VRVKTNIKAGAFGLILCGLAASGGEAQPPVKEYTLDLAPHHVAFSPDSRRVAIGGSGPSGERGGLREGIALVVDTATGMTLARHHFSGERPGSGTTNYVTALQFTPDGARLVVADALGIYLWIPAGDRVKTVVEEPGVMPGVTSVAFSPDGKQLATSDRSTITVRDAATLQPRRSIPVCGAAVAFSPDGRWLASAEQSNLVHLWDVATGERLAEDHAMMGVLFDVAFAPDGRWLAAVGGGVKLWDVTTREGKPALRLRRALVGHLGEVYSVDVSPDGKRLVTTSYDRSLKVWDATTGRQLAARLSRSKRGEAAFSPDGKTLAAVGASDANPARPVLWLWKLEELLDPETVEVQARADVAELFRLAGAAKSEEGNRQLAALGPAPETTVPLLMEGLKSRDQLTRRLALAALAYEAEAARPFLPEIRALLGGAAQYYPAREALEEIEGHRP